MATRERAARAVLIAGSLLFSFLAGEAAFSVIPLPIGNVLNVYNRQMTAGLDCYPSDPRGYFDLDLRDPATRARFRTLGVRRVEDCAEYAPHAVELRYNALQFRDREPPPRTAGLRRVAVLGDSFTEGQGVKELDWSILDGCPSPVSDGCRPGDDGRTAHAHGSRDPHCVREHAAHAQRPPGARLSDASCG